MRGSGQRVSRARGVAENLLDWTSLGQSTAGGLNVLVSLSLTTAQGTNSGAVAWHEGLRCLLAAYSRFSNPAGSSNRVPAGVVSRLSFRFDRIAMVQRWFDAGRDWASSGRVGAGEGVGSYYR